MRALHRKLLRDLGGMKGQVAAIGVVIGAGVMVLILSVTMLDAVQRAQQSFYQSGNFAHVFADLTRAPEHHAGRLREIPGVNQVETRVRAPVRLEVPGFDDPVRGVMISVPDGRQPDVNRLHLREGDLPDPARNDQVVLNEPFAEAHGLHAGDRLTAIIRGRLQALTVSGVALSPEFVYQVGPADLLPDYERYGVLWMNRRALGNAFNMDGAFNSVVFTLQAGVREERVIEAVDELLARYGGVGAHGRDELISHRMLSDEIGQLRVMSIILPGIFLGVSAFLLNVLIARIIRNQRQQIAVLKAFGYGNGEIGMHYAQLTGLIVLAGCAVGIAAGAWAGDALSDLYAEYFRFPDMRSDLRPGVILLAITVALTAGMLGTLRSVHGAVRLPPAEAMRPPMPETFRQGWLERSVFGRLLDQPSRIILRNLGRHRFKAALSVFGIGLSGALLLLGAYQFNSVNHLIDTQYRFVLKADVHVTFTDPTPARALAELRVQPGIHYAEGYRAVPVRLVHGTRDYRTTLEGLEPEPALRGLIDARRRPIAPPAEGVLLTRYLADELGLLAGDRVQIEIMEGHRRTIEAQVAATVDEPLNIGAYMERRSLNRLMREGPAITGVWLMTDRTREQALFDRLWDMPRVASIGLIAESERNLREYIDDTVLVMMGILLVLAGSIAFAVVYNNARIAFAERVRELATLRVLGFTRGEVAWILVGEMLLLTLLALPIAWLVGTGFSWLLHKALQLEMIRAPFVLDVHLYAFAALGLLLATALSVLLIARRLRHVDMVSALKTLE